jgi:hypothetical protein
MKRENVFDDNHIILNIRTERIPLNLHPLGFVGFTGHSGDG